MSTKSLPYGHTSLSIHLPPTLSVDWIEPLPYPSAADPRAVVCAALENPLGGVSLDQYRTARRVVIAINDKTRPVPHEHLLPPLLDALHAVGIADAAVTFLIATGTHLPMPASEFPRILPAELCARYSILSHNCDDAPNLVYLGETQRGTPVWINRLFHEADLRIAVGNIEPHHFAGFSGGYKTAAIGLAGRATINHNHAMLVEPPSRMAEYALNPLRQDIEDIGDLLHLEFALNAVLNGEKRIVQAFSGSPRAVIAAGMPVSRAVCQLTVNQKAAHSVPQKYDLVIASVGGAPKDINFYQSQKALTHASLFTRDGGVIILAAECPEGSGNRAYEEFMQGVESPQAVFTKFRQMGFRVGPHKAFQVARDAARVRIVIVSAMAPSLVTALLMTPAADLDQALVTAQSLLGNPPIVRAAILPRATNTIPGEMPVIIPEK